MLFLYTSRSRGCKSAGNKVSACRALPLPGKYICCFFTHPEAGAASLRETKFPHAEHCLSPANIYVVSLHIRKPGLQVCGKQSFRMQSTASPRQIYMLFLYTSRSRGCKSAGNKVSACRALPLPANVYVVS